MGNLGLTNICAYLLVLASTLYESFVVPAPPIATPVNAVAQSRPRRKPRCVRTPLDKRLQPPPKAGFCHVLIFWVCPRLDALTVSDGMGLSVRQAARLVPCFQHPVHPLRLKTWRVALSLNQEHQP